MTLKPKYKIGATVEVRDFPRNRIVVIEDIDTREDDGDDTLVYSLSDETWTYEIEVIREIKTK